MITGLGLGITASAHKFVAAGPTNLDAIDVGQDESPAAYYSDTSITKNGLSASRYMTVSFWFWTETRDAFNRAWYIDVSSGLDILFNIAGTDQMQFLMLQSGNVRNRIRTTTTTALQDQAWHHCLIVFDNEASGSCKMYIDGVEEGTDIVANAAYDFEYNNIVGIGVGQDINSLVNAWDGKLAQLWIDNSYQDSITSFYDTTNDKAKDLGTDGTATGLGQPLIYHYGNTSTFPTNNGRTSGGYLSGYSLSMVGTVTDATGPAL